MNSPRKARVFLTEEQRVQFEKLVKADSTPARTLRHARILLHADQAHPEGCRSDEWIAEALGMHANSVARIRKLFVLGGEAAALNRKVRATPAVPRKIDGRVEAHIVAICCSKAPEGRTRWTLQLIADEVKARGVITSICVESVRKVLKKTNCDPGRSSPGASPSVTGRGSSRTWSGSSTSTQASTHPSNR